MIIFITPRHLQYNWLPQRANPSLEVPVRVDSPPTTSIRIFAFSAIDKLRHSKNVAVRQCSKTHSVFFETPVQYLNCAATAGNLFAARGELPVWISLTKRYS